MIKYLLMFVAASVVLVGCNNEAEPDNPERIPPPTQAKIDEQIAKIKADPAMTEENKQRAIQGIEMSRKMSQQGGQGSGKPGGNN